MFAGRIDVLVSQDIRNQVDVPRRSVQAGSVGTAQLMGSDLFEGGGQSRVFFDKVFDGADRDPPVLEGEEEGMFMTGHRSNPPADLKVVLQCPLNFLTEVNDCLIPALSDNTDSVVSEINIFDIKSNALGDTDSGTKKQC